MLTIQLGGEINWFYPGFSALICSSIGEDPHVSESAEVQRWEYFVTPLLLHNEAQILNNWGAQGWELVQIIEGPAGGNVAYLKRKA